MDRPAEGREAGDGQTVAAYYRAAARWLAQHAARIDALNVFPVPDGDTGTNMRLTLQAASEAADRQGTADAGQVAAAAAEAALLGARGNSGVILSQALAGLAAGLRDQRLVDRGAIRRAAEEAVRLASRAVANPVEGTLLTAIRDVADVLQRPEQPSETGRAVLEAAAAAAHASVARSPELLPRLREAGVVDAGADGLAVILDGMARYARGDSLDLTGALAMVYPHAVAGSADGHALDEHGYCTNFVVRGGRTATEQLRAEILALGASAVVAEAGDLIKVHLHTEHPGRALEVAARYGELTAIEIANMREQVAAGKRDAASRHSPNGVAPPPLATATGLLAVVPSQPLAQLFAGFGAAILLGGQTMNPSIGDLLAAAEQTSAEHIFILPNNSNVVLAAGEAARRCRRPTSVIPSTTVPQGVAAAVAFLAGRDPEENVRAMTEALATVVTIEVTIASRATTLEGAAVEAGQALALVDGQFATVADGPEAAALAAVARTYRPEFTLLTLYTGQDVPAGRAEELRRRLQERLPDVQLEVVTGGQPHYPYIIALE